MFQFIRDFLGGKNRRDKNLEKEKLLEEQKKFYWGPTSEEKWDEEEKQRILEILTERYSKEGMAPVKILVFGITGHGKSSFCNSCQTALLDRDIPWSAQAVAKRNESVTTKLSICKYEKLSIIDMPGVFEDDAIQSESIESIISGKVPFDAEIDKHLNVKGTLNTKPEEIDCVVITLRHDAELGPELKRQIGTVIKVAGKGGPCFHVVLTHLDECDPQFNNPENIKDMYKSAKVQDAVQKISTQTGIMPISISFVKNYVNETKRNDNISLCHLKVLERLTVMADDKKGTIQSKSETVMPGTSQTQ